MNRGPAALFGAIVAVGLGPAMWLGVRLGAVEVAPSKPPAVVGEHTSGPDRLVGGTGAGESPIDNLPSVAATPRGKVLPLTAETSPSAAATSSSPAVRTPATPSSSPATQPQTTPPTESTTVPVVPSTETTTGSAPPPEPPPSDNGGGSDDPAGPGEGLTESGDTGDTGGIAAGSAVG